MREGGRAAGCPPRTGGAPARACAGTVRRSPAGSPSGAPLRRPSAGSAGPRPRTTPRTRGPARAPSTFHPSRQTWPCASKTEAARRARPRSAVRASPRCPPCLRLLERSAHQHLHELPAVLGAREGVGRRPRALRGSLRRRRRIGAPANASSTPAARRGRSAMFVRATEGPLPFCASAATPTSAQSCARRWNFR